MINKRNFTLGLLLGVVLFILFVFLSMSTSHYGELYVYGGSYDNGAYNLSVSFTPSKDMPNSRLTAKLFAEDGSLIGENSDGILIQNNYVGGKEYDFWMVIPLTQKKRPKKLVIELSNQNKLDHLETNDIYRYTKIKNDIFEDPYSLNNTNNTK